jgi:hypothetical protein
VGVYLKIRVRQSLENNWWGEDRRGLLLRKIHKCRKSKPRVLVDFQQNKRFKLFSQKLVRDAW